jgi:hypothetical protein
MSIWSRAVEWALLCRLLALAGIGAAHLVSLAAGWPMRGCP